MRASAIFASVPAIQLTVSACAIVACAGGLASCGAFGETEAKVDGGVPADGGSSDASGTGDASRSVRFCNAPGPTTFCEDFDDDTDVASPFDFDVPDVVTPGQLSVATDVVRSAPRSLVAGLGGGGLAWVAKNLPGPLPTHLSVAFDFRVIDYVATSTPTGHFVEVRCASTEANHIYLKIDDGSLSVGIKQDQGPVDGTFKGVFTKGTWAKVQLVLDKPTDGGYLVTLFVNDAMVVASQAVILSDCQQGNLRVGLGARSSDPVSKTASFAFGFDNVLIDWK